MNLRATFARLRGRGETALIPYLTAGFPTLVKSMENLQTVARAGGDILEIGVPFSDPIADGPTIQFASQKALEQGVTLRAILTALRAWERNCPVVLMSYLNPLLAFGAERLIPALGEAGVEGLIVPDLPAAEAGEWSRLCRTGGVNLIGLVAPTSTDERIQAVARGSDGFVYCVSLTGTTGARECLSPETANLLGRVRRLTRASPCAGAPIVVGFGISKPEHVRALHGLADGVVVGSRLVEAVRQREDLTLLVRSLKEATRGENHAHRNENECRAGGD